MCANYEPSSMVATGDMKGKRKKMNKQYNPPKTCPVFEGGHEKRQRPKEEMRAQCCDGSLLWALEKPRGGV